MSPGRKFAIDVTWSWPVVFLLAIAILLPVWGPLVGPIEGMIAPVTGKVTFIQRTEVEGGFTVRMSYTKLRNCEIVGVSMDQNGVAIEFEPVENSQATLTTRGTGPQISREWFVGARDLDGLRLRWLHRCSPFYITVTVAYP